MKKLLFSLCAMLLTGAGTVLAQSTGVYAEVTANDDGSGNYTLTIKAGYHAPKVNNDGTGFFNAGGLASNSYSFNGTDTVKITKVIIDESVKNARPTSTAFWFDNLGRISEIEGLENLNTSEVTDMEGMFGNCTRLKALDVSNFDTKKVTDMSFMFNLCKSLPKIEGLKNFNTSEVTDMQQMFSGCGKLEALDVTNFDTKNVTDMRGMFNACYSLPAIVGVENFNTSEVTNMNGMFNGCNKLEGILDVTNFDTKNVTDMSGMFSSCYSLQAIKGVGDFNTSKVTNMSYMFNSCRSLDSLGVSKYDTKNVTSMQDMFLSCGATNPIILDWDVSKVTTMYRMFYSNQSSYIKCNFRNAENVTTMEGMFYNSKAKTIEFVCPDSKNVTTMQRMFQSASAKKLIYDINTESVENMSYMFNYSNLDTIDISKFKTDKVSNVKGFASWPKSLRELNLGKNDFFSKSSHDDCFEYVGYTTTTMYPGGVATQYKKYAPVHLTFDFPISSLGETKTAYSISLDKAREATDNMILYNNEIVPFHEYCGGIFYIADTLDCRENKSYDYKNAKESTRETDLWQYKRTMKLKQWNTLFVPVQTKVSDLKTTNYITQVSKMDSYDGTTLKFKTMADDDIIPANTPVLVWSNIQLSSLAYPLVKIENPTEEQVNNELAVSTEPVNGYYAKFYGCYEYGKVLDNTCYFYNYSNGKFTHSLGNSYCDNTRGYFRFFKDDSAETNGAKQFALDDGGIITNITSIDGEPVGQGSDKMYNLSGQRVGQSYKGIVIVGGKKVLRK